MIGSIRPSQVPLSDGPHLPPIRFLSSFYSVRVLSWNNACVRVRSDSLDVVKDTKDVDFIFLFSPGLSLLEVCVN